jgi:heat shock protein HslJ
VLARLIFLLLAAVATAGALAACGGDDEEGEAGGTLQGVVWQWQESLYSDESEAVPEDPAQYTIEFADDGSAAVKADCNQVRAEYESDADGTISIVLGPSTLAACPPGTLDAEFLRDLEGAAIYFFDDDGLLRIDIKFSTGTMTFDSAA